MSVSSSLSPDPRHHVPTSPPRPAGPKGPAILGGEVLTPVSPKLIAARYLARSVGWAIELAIVVGLVVLAVLQGWWWPLLIAALLVVHVVQAVLLLPRRVRALGYRDREEDLVVATGILMRDVTTTPYGRIQSVEIGEGPIERHFGLATISFSTAAPAGSGTIPGLPKAEAERLRELLTRRGIDRMQSL